MTESAPDELVLDRLLPRIIAEAEAALRRPNRGRAGRDLLRPGLELLGPAVTSLAAFDANPPDPARMGVPEAYHLAVDRYLDCVFRFVYYRAGDRRLAAELATIAVRRVLRRIDTFTGPDRELGAWLIGTARQVLADYPPGDRPLPPVDDPAHPSRDGGAELVNGPLLTAIRQLDPEQRDCLVLRFLQALSIAETARAMGQTESRVRTVEQRGVSALNRLVPLGPPPTWPDRVRRRTQQARHVLRRVLVPRPPDLFRGDGEESGTVTDRGAVNDTGRLIVLGLQLRAIPITRSGCCPGTPCPSHPITCPPPRHLAHPGPETRQPGQSGAPTFSRGHGGSRGEVGRGPLLTSDSDARLRSMLLAIVSEEAVTMAGSDGAGTPGGAARTAARLVVTGRTGRGTEDRAGRSTEGRVGRSTEGRIDGRWRRGRTRSRDAVVVGSGPLPADCATR